MDNPDSGRKPIEKKSPEKKTPQVGTNVIGYLLALGIGALLIVVLLNTRNEAELPYLQLLELIKKGNPRRTDIAETPGKKPVEPPHVEVVENDENPNSRRVIWYSELRELTVGPTEVTGKVTQDLRQEGSKPPDPSTKAKEVEFRSARMGFENDGGMLQKLLDENGFTDVRGQSAPSRMRDYLPALMFAGLIVLFVVIMMRRFGGAGSPMAFGRSRGKMYAQEDIGVTFEEVAGIEEAVDELREVVEFLRSPEKYQVLGGRIPKGVL
ncbi:MAG: hypothetical protein ACREHD_27385, partial [Pirellulales bacterium]